MHTCSGIVMINDALIAKNHRPTINLVYRYILRNKNTYYCIIMHYSTYSALQAYKSRINHTYLSTNCKVLITKSRKYMIYSKKLNTKIILFEQCYLLGAHQYSKLI